MSDLYRNIIRRLDNMTIKMNTIEYNTTNNTVKLSDYYNKEYIDNSLNTINDKIDNLIIENEGFDPSNYYTKFEINSSFNNINASIESLNSSFNTINASFNTINASFNTINASLENIYLNTSNVINGDLNNIINNIVQEIQFLRGFVIKDVGIYFRSVGISNISYISDVIVPINQTSYNIINNSLFPTSLGSDYYLQYPFNYNIEENNDRYEIILLGDNSENYTYRDNNVKIRNTGILNISYYDLPLLAYNGTEITSLNGLFNNCASLKNIDLSNFDISNITQTASMFAGCKSLTSLDLSNFDTSKVNDMRSMFANCNSLTSLDLSNFDTSNVNHMYYMFQNCSSLTNIDLSNFDTSKVNQMFNMFAGCSSLTSLDLSSFDTSNATIMINMFYNCSSLTSLDLSNFNTTNVGQMGGMFAGCSSLINLDLSNFDTSNVTQTSNMFQNCSALTNVSINFNCSNISGVLTQGTGKTITNWPDPFEQNKVYMLILQ